MKLTKTTAIFLLSMFSVQLVAAECDCTSAMSKFFAVLDKKTERVYSSEEYDVDKLYNGDYSVAFSEAFNKQCTRLESREFVETEIARFERVTNNEESIDKLEAAGKEAVFELINHTVLPTLSIERISFNSAGKTGDDTEIHFEMVSACGYSWNYSLDIETHHLKVLAKGARID